MKMNRNKELAKNTAVISLGKLCTQFLSFVLLPLYTSVLTAAEYGTVDLLTTYQRLIGYVVFLRIEQALFRHIIDVRENEDEGRTIVTTTLAFALFQAVLLGIIFALIYAFTAYEYTLYLYACTVSVVFSELMLQSARGFGRNAVYAMGSFISSASAIIFNIVFLVGLRLGACGMLSAFILGNAFGAAYVFLRLRVYRMIGVTNFSFRHLCEALRYSLPLVPNVLAWWVMSASDRTVAAYLLGTSYSGLLAVSQKFSSAYTNFYTVFNQSWTESASLHVGESDSEEFFAGVIFKVYRLFSAAAIGVIALMPFVFDILINESYAEAYYQLPIYMIAALLNVVQGLYSVIYIALKKTGDIAKITVVSAVTDLLLNIALIRFIGLYAASLSTLAAFAVNALWRYFDLKKYMNIRFDKKLLLSSAAVMTVVCVGYYSRDVRVQAVCLVLAVAYAVYINRGIIKPLIGKMRRW